jgi:ketosteroid isomerase-like protein
VAIDRELTEDEAALVTVMTHNSWGKPGSSYGTSGIDFLVGMYTEDAISTPAGHPTLQGHDDIRAWYTLRAGSGFRTNAISEVESIDVVGDIAVLTGVFRITRDPEDGVPALDHAGRWLSVMKKVDGRWLMWRDMDTPSPDADHLYHRLARGN